ncbi:MAG TPA: hypothetical protein PLI27_02325 [Ignavibacteriales bacterium]|nr:hypothetical protein [Ignavibacteriales bacterium]HOL81644.1 hypothetical protein [Ignavibacteriales bacterium]HOM65175.1 hypothetical protein [Ignavibacteriales bacterium]HPD66899.1 hypothetical protein [Ignavibacteriales bacterium]HPP33758.1 hypothetical protein [Ignavibacteriales bacterium]
MISNLITLSIDDFKMKYVEFSLRNNKLFIENIDEEFFDDFITLNDKETKIIFNLDSAFKEILLRKKNIHKDISITLPSRYFYIVKLPYDISMSNKKLNSYLKWELPIIYPEIKNQDVIVQNIKMEGNYCLAIGIKRTIINTIKKFVENSNLNLKLIENEHLSFNRFIKYYPKVDNSNYLIVYVGNNYFTLSYNTPTNMIDFRMFNYDELSEIIEKTHNYYNENIKSNDLFVNLFITGNYVSDTFIKHFEATNTFILRRLNPFDNIPYNPKLINSKLYTSKNYTFATNVALTLS